MDFPFAEVPDHRMQMQNKQFQVVCSGCERVFLVQTELLSRRVTCGCGEKFRIDWALPSPTQDKSGTREVMIWELIGWPGHGKVARSCHVIAHFKARKRTQVLLNDTYEPNTADTPRGWTMTRHTPAIVDSVIYLRTHSKLYALGDGK